jgi:ATP-dependent 26S proteasome regulatory subunit
VKKVANGSVKKTGILLHGKPGNGKTQFVKYLARKYLLPIHVVYLRPDYDNYDIARMFSEVPRRCIVLLEDFDNYFNGRECLMKNDQVRFTFDSVINALDGVHNDYRGVVFVMTANDIDKIDDSIKNRPSRFKFVKEVCPPDFDLRMKVLGSESLAREMEGASLDSVFARKHS